MPVMEPNLDAATLTAWGYMNGTTVGSTTSGTGFVQGNLGDFNAAGIGAYTGTNEGSANQGEHAFDNIATIAQRSVIPLETAAERYLALVGAVALLGDGMWRMMGRGGVRLSSGGGGRSGKKDDANVLLIVLVLIWLLSWLLAPFITRLLAMSVSREREYLADAMSAQFTRNPLALASALEVASSGEADCVVSFSSAMASGPFSAQIDTRSKPRRLAWMSKNTRLANTAVKIEVAMPISSVIAKPRTGPEPYCQSTRPAIAVVSCESRMVVNARS